MTGAAILIPLAAIICPFILVIAVRYYDNMEKMAMIDKGLVPTNRKFQVNPAAALRWGFLLLGGGLGLLAGGFLSAFTPMDEDVAYFSMVLIGGGLGLLLAYFIAEGKEREQQSKNDA